MVEWICILPASRPTEGWRLESFLVALGVVFPMLVMMASGVILRKTGMADRPLVRRVDAINFHLFLPCLLFYNIYNVGPGLRGGGAGPVPGPVPADRTPARPPA